MFDTLKTLNIKAEADYEVQDFDRCANCRWIIHTQYPIIHTQYPPAVCRKLSDKMGVPVYISDDGICKHYERKSND